MVITFSKKNSRANTRECKQLPSIRRLFQNTVNVSDKFVLGGFNSLRQLLYQYSKFIPIPSRCCLWRWESGEGRCTKKNSEWHRSYNFKKIEAQLEGKVSLICCQLDSCWVVKKEECAACYYESPRTIWVRLAKLCDLPEFLSWSDQGHAQVLLLQWSDWSSTQCIVFTGEETGRHLFWS